MSEGIFLGVALRFQASDMASLDVIGHCVRSELHSDGDVWPGPTVPQKSCSQLLDLQAVCFVGCWVFRLSAAKVCKRLEGGEKRLTGGRGT